MQGFHGIASPADVGLAVFSDFAHEPNERRAVDECVRGQLLLAYFTQGDSSRSKTIATHSLDGHRLADGFFDGIECVSRASSSLFCRSGLTWSPYFGRLSVGFISGSGRFYQRLVILCWRGDDILVVDAAAGHLLPFFPSISFILRDDRRRYRSLNSRRWFFRPLRSIMVRDFNEDLPRAIDKHIRE